VKAVSISSLRDIEGSVHFLIIRRGGKLVARRRHGGSGIVFNRRLRAGRYTVTSYVRGCVGNCAELDEPVAKCTRTFRVRPGARTSVTIPSDLPDGPRCPTTRPVLLRDPGVHAR
jgi:hypothetical protein